MSHGFSTWHLAITPLSPVHVGTGEDYEPTQYVIDGTGLYSFSPEAALRALPEAARADLSRILGDPPTVDLLLQVRDVFRRQAERLIPEAEHVIPVLPTIAAEYAARVGKTAQNERERDIINQLRIARTYGDAAARRPILPGSSLKGAIRTALLDRVNDRQGLRRVTDRKTGRDRPENNQELQNRLFGYQAGRFEKDPMRLVHLGDAADVRPPETLGTEIRYAVNRKRQPVTKDGRELLAQAENLRQVIECIPPLRPRAFRGQLSLQDLGGLTGSKVPAPEPRWTFEELADACQAFYRPILERELRELGARGYLDATWRAAIRQILDAQAQAFSDRRAFLLRVGFHSGAESVTLNGVRSIKIMKGSGQQPDYLPVTKTVWLAAREIQQRRDLVPFGWVLVEASPHDRPFADWPVGLTEQGLNEATAETDWRAAVAARRRALRERLDAERAHDQTQREAAERQAREAAERAARLAQLSAQGRQLEELRARLEQDRRANVRQAGGELANRLVALLKEAADAWPAEDGMALADLAEEIYGYLGWPASQKKRERQAQIQALRQKPSA